MTRRGALEIIADFARVMDYLGITFGVLKKEKCTGDPARRLGNDLLFGSLAEAGLKALETAKVQKIVTICPHCVRTIARTTGGSMGSRLRSSTTRSLWLGIASVCRSRVRGRASFITILVIWGGIGMFMRRRGRLLRWRGRWWRLRDRMSGAFVAGLAAGWRCLGEEKGEQNCEPCEGEGVG